MKKLLICAACALSIVAASGVCAQTPPALYVDNAYVQPVDVQPFIDSNDRLQVPVRLLSESMNASVLWDGEQQKVEIVSDSNDIYLVIYIGSNIMYRNSKAVQMDTEAVIIDDRTFIPARFAAEGLGYVVDTAEDMSYVTFTEDPNADKLQFNENGVIDYVEKARNDSGEYLCSAEVYAYDEAPAELKAALEGKESSPVYETLTIDDIGKVEETAYTVGNTIYSESLSYAGASPTLYSNTVLTSLSDDIVIEYIPDENNSKFNLCIDLNKNFYDIHAQVGIAKIAEIWIPSDQHTIIKIPGVYRDKIIYPTFGIEPDTMGFGLMYRDDVTEGEVYALGTVRVAAAGEIITEQE